MKTYRVFTTRHYIAVDWYDVRAVNAGIARRNAVNAVKRLRPDARAEATDNGWHGDDPVTVPRIGYHAFGTHRMKKIAPGVYKGAQ